MKLPKFDYQAPESLGEACKISAREGRQALIIAGGTDLLQALKNGLKKPGMLLDIGSLAELRQLTYSAQQGLTIGALVTLRQLAAQEAVRKAYPLLAQTALTVGSVQLQAMGTLGGNLCQDTCCLYYNLPPMSRLGLDPCFKLEGKKCHVVTGSKVCWATYSGDMAPALLVLQATVTIADRKGEKTLPLQEIYSGRGESPYILKPGQILKTINVPPPPSPGGGVYLKMRMRKSIDYPLLGVAVAISLHRRTGLLKNSLVALTAVDKAPLLITRPKEIEEAKTLEQQIEIMVQAAHGKAHPVANTSGYSPRYRREMVGVYVRQGIEQALAMASGKGNKA